MEAGLLQWNLIHKHHLVAHMPAQAAYLNPKLVSTYSGETMVGFMASLAHACLNGSPPHLVPVEVQVGNVAEIHPWIRNFGV